MTNREAAMRKLQTAKFALLDLHLYLDTHPEDLEMIAAYKKAAAKYVLALDAFTEQYGPVQWLRAPGVEWLQNPWPWDAEVCN